MKKYLSFLAAALLLAACQSDDIAEQKAQAYLDGSIQFGVESAEDVTRTPGGTIGVIGDNNEVNGVQYIGEDPLSKYGFGVFASYTGDNVYENVTVKSDFMYNQKVQADGTNWVYDPLKYWPNTGKTTFFAYAPYVDHTKLDFEKPYKFHCIAGMSDPNDEGDPWLIYVLAPSPWQKNWGQSDLLYGVNASNSYKPWYDQTKADFDAEPMKFTFKHALGIIGDEIKIKIDETILGNLKAAKAKIYIDHIDMKYKNLTRKAKLILNSKNQPNWKPIVSGEVTTEREVTITKEEIDALNVNSKVGKYSVLDGYVDVDNEHYLNVDGLEETTPIVLKTGKGLFYIPYQVDQNPQQLEVTLYYQILAENMEPYNGVATSTTILSEKAGKCQDVIITINKDPKWDKIYAPKVGDFYFSDGTWGDNNPHETGALPIGCIVYLGNDIGTFNRETGEKGTAKHGLVMAFKNTAHTFEGYTPGIPAGNPGSSKYNRWGIGGADTPLENCSNFASAYNDLNGEYNTNVLYNLWLTTNTTFTNTYWAAWECSNYATQGVGAKGNWHIGTFGEWARIIDSMAKNYPISDPTVWSGTDIYDAIQANTIADGTKFYPITSGHSLKEDYEGNNYNHYGMFDSGVLDRNKLKQLRYWTSTEVNGNNAVSFEFMWDDDPNLNDAVGFFLNTSKSKEYLIRPLLTF